MYLVHGYWHRGNNPRLLFNATNEPNKISQKKIKQQTHNNKKLHLWCN